METLIVKYNNRNKAVKQVLNGLKNMGAIVIEKFSYDEDFVRKIAKGDRDLIAGKGIVVNTDALWK